MGYALIGTEVGPMFGEDSFEGAYDCWRLGIPPSCSCRCGVDRIVTAGVIASIGYCRAFAFVSEVITL
jgi:hypothetical protein